MHCRQKNSLSSLNYPSVLKSLHILVPTIKKIKAKYQNGFVHVVTKRNYCTVNKIKLGIPQSSYKIVEFSHFHSYSGILSYSKLKNDGNS